MSRKRGREFVVSGPVRCGAWFLAMGLVCVSSPALASCPAAEPEQVSVVVRQAHVRDVGDRSLAELSVMHADQHAGSAEVLPLGLTLSRFIIGRKLTAQVAALPDGRVCGSAAQVDF